MAGYPTSIRLSEAALKELADLEAKLRLKRSPVIEQAIRRLHEAEIGPPKKSEKKSGKKG